MATNSESSLENDPSEDNSVNILILGDVGIGKTSLIQSYLSTIGKSVEELDMEELDIFVKYPVKMKCKGKVIDVGLIDLYPGSNSPERRDCYPMDVNVILLCFSVDQYSTLNSISNLWIHEVRAHFGKLIPVFLVGLRSDTRIFHAFDVSDPQSEQNRLVEKIEAENIHKNYNFHGDYMECTMLDEDSVTDVLKKAVLSATEV